MMAVCEGDEANREWKLEDDDVSVVGDEQWRERARADCELCFEGFVQLTVAKVVELQMSRVI